MPRDGTTPLRDGSRACRAGHLQRMIEARLGADETCRLDASRSSDPSVRMDLKDNYSLIRARATGLYRSPGVFLEDGLIAVQIQRYNVKFVGFADAVDMLLVHEKCCFAKPFTRTDEVNTARIFLTCAAITAVMAIALISWLTIIPALFPHWTSQRLAAHLAREFASRTRPILEHGEIFELYSLDGGDVMNGTVLPKDRFAGWPSYGKLVITDSRQRQALIDSLYTSVAMYHGELPACFMPHHGIHAQAGSHQVDLVICFSCNQIEGTIDGSAISAGNDGKPLILFNQVLHVGGVTLAPGMNTQ